MIKNKKKTLSLILFVFPAFALYVTFLLIPMIGATYYSFTDWTPFASDYNFVGLNNYIEAFRDDAGFRQAFFLTLRFTAVIFVLQNVIALGLALLIETKMRSKPFFRTVFFLPNMLSLIISALMFRFIFTNAFPELGQTNIFAFLNQEWLGNPTVSFWSIVIVSLWQGVGYMMIIYMAALQGVPKNLTEAAMIDGANAVQRLRNVTIPMIMHAITICSFLTLSGAFQVFDVVFRLTGGGPGRSTQVIALNIFEEAFSNNFRYGYANAKAMILFLVILTITLIQTSILKKKEVEA